MSISSHYFFIIFVCIVSLFFHFVAIDYPQEAVFDEVHFGKFISGYLTGEYFFDIHPPLGKLAIAGMARVAGFKPGFDFQTIGEQYPNSQYIWLRFLPALFGSFLAPLIYVLVWRISRAKRASRMAALFVAFENALLVQSKFILIDSFLLFFGFVALYLFLESNIFFTQGRWRGLWVSIGAAFFLGLAISVKWTALSFFGLILLFGFGILIKKMLRLWRKGSDMYAGARADIAKTALAFGMLLVIPIIIYISLFALHFALLKEKGSGDAYMTARFQQSREIGFPLHDFPNNFFELNREMYRANQRITATHSYSSLWYTWPFMLRPVYYWDKSVPPEQAVWYAKIYLIGNPFIWWLSTISVMYFFVNAVILTIRQLVSRIFQRVQKKDILQRSMFASVFLGIGYLINLLPFILIGRLMFLYHYLSALVFAIVIAALMLTSETKPRKFLSSVLIAGMLLGFLVMFPITYGTFLPAAWPRYVFWLQSWI